jgi:hypothetical protein
VDAVRVAGFAIRYAPRPVPARLSSGSCTGFRDRPAPLAKQQVTVQVADFQYRKWRYHGPIYVYRDRFTPGQHWQPWPAGRHHRYWHGGVTSVYCHGIISIPEARCYDRDW